MLKQGLVKLEPKPMSEPEFEAFLNANARQTVTDIILDHKKEVQRLHAKKVSYRKIGEYLTTISGVRVDSSTVHKVLSQPDTQEQLAAEINLLTRKREVRDLIRRKIASGGRITKAELSQLADDEQAMLPAGDNAESPKAKMAAVPHQEAKTIVAPAQSSPTQTPAAQEVVTERKASESGKLSLAERARISEKNENAPPPRSNLWSRKIDDGAQQR